MTTPLDTLIDALGAHQLRLVDVGAADGLSKRWRPIARALDVIAFEPDARSDAQTSADGARTTVVPKAAAETERESKLWLTRKPRCSSLLHPNADVIDRFPDAERYGVVDEAMVACTSVDAALKSLHGSTHFDFIKIDTQGTELDVLRGASEGLRTCLGIETEVEFLPLYEGAAPFRDIDAFVSEHGLELYDLRRTYFRRKDATSAIQKRGQLVFGDALYFRDWRSGGLNRTALLKLATLLITYGYADEAAELAASALDKQDAAIVQNACAALIVAADLERKDSFIGTGLKLPD